MRELTIGKNDAGQRLDKFLRKAMPQLSAGLVYRSIRQKKIKCNGKRCTPEQKLCEGDSIQLYLRLEEDKSSALPFLRVPPELDAVYEDRRLLLINKPAGLVVHSDDRGSTDTLLLRVQHYLYQKGEYCPDKEQSFAPALCNRIDRNTSGIVLAAKDAETLRIISEKLRTREIEKRYLCLINGTPDLPEAVLTHYLKKDSAQNRVDIFDKPAPGGKTAKTAYRVVESKNGLSLVEIELLTGRTHQIRAQMAHIGHPLFGDGKYGVNRSARAQGYPYQALCAYRVRFAFREAGILSYLAGQSFRLHSIPFADDFSAGRLYGERKEDVR